MLLLLPTHSHYIVRAICRLLLVGWSASDWRTAYESVLLQTVQMNQMQANSTSHTMSSSLMEGILSGKGVRSKSISSSGGGGGGGGTMQRPPGHPLQQHISIMHHSNLQQSIPLQLPLGAGGAMMVSGGYSSSSNSNISGSVPMMSSSNGSITEGGDMVYGVPGPGLVQGTGLVSGPGLIPVLSHPISSVNSVGVGVVGGTGCLLPQGGLPPLHPSSYSWQQQQQQQQQQQPPGHPSSSSSSSSYLHHHPRTSSISSTGGDASSSSSSSSSTLSLNHIPPSVQREYQMLYPDAGPQIPTPLARASSPQVLWGQGKGIYMGKRTQTIHPRILLVLISYSPHISLVFL